MEKVLIIGVITLPVLLFLAFFTDNVLTDTDTNATAAKTEAQKLMDLVTE
ncbi:MAG: hypothetical protein ACU0BB_04635 [Paracoccaceae bacterium]